MHKKHMFLRVFQKIALFSCIFYVFCMPSMVFALPSGYVELEYIAKNNASQYIQTDYVGNLNSRYEGAVYVTSVADEYYIASRSGSGDTRHIALGSAKGAQVIYGLYVGHGKFMADATRLAANLNKRMDFVTDFPNGEFAVAIDGGVTITKAIPSSAIVTSFTNTAPLQIFFNRVAGATSAASYAAPIGTRIYYLKIYENNNLVHHFIPAKRSSDNVVGMYDVVENEFLTNVIANTGLFTAGPIVACKTFGTDNVTCTACKSGYKLSNNGACTEEIKIATTKFVDEEFAAAEEQLATTVQTIEEVVSNTITQTEQIATLQSEKQTRPNETCPAGKKCLLVTDGNGTPHWYEIIEPAPAFNTVEFWNQLINTIGNNYYHAGNTTTYNEVGGSSRAFTIQPPASSGLRQLNETEWAVQWNGKGAVYGTSVCNGNPGTQGVASSTEQTETKGQYCWCKMTSVGGLDGVEHDVSSSAWVFDGAAGSAAGCANYCARDCAGNVRVYAGFRAAVFGVGN